MSFSNKTYIERVGIEFDGAEVFREILDLYGLGSKKYSDVELVKSGYEDYNSRIRFADSEGVFIKIFASWRDESRRERYLSVLRTMQRNKVVMPFLFQQPVGQDHFRIEVGGGSIHGIVLQLVDKGSLLEAEHWLDSDEIVDLAKITAAINLLDYRPSFEFDSWAISNVGEKLNLAKGALDPEDQPVVLRKVCEQLNGIDFSMLPHCFTHGDIRRSNILRSSTGEPSICDFSVANYQARVIELAVIAHDTLFRPQEPQRFASDVETFIEAYVQYVPLEDVEIEVLPFFIRAAAAVDVLGGAVALSTGSSGPEFIAESQYWRQLGRAGVTIQNLFA